MQVRIFTVPVHDDGSAVAELNRFLAGHRVVEIERKFYANDLGGYWSFCIVFTGAVQTASASALQYKQKVDYKAILGEAEFTAFTQLRAIRKQLAEEDAVPAYAVFTDEELATIARMPDLKPQDMKAIPGIGIKRMERYGVALHERFVAINRKEP
jgi:superfamily II DNA helicase RecQ